MTTSIIPVKPNFVGGVPVSLGEFVPGDVVPIAFGGTGRVDGGATAFKNAIINGAMMVDQRNAGAAVTPTTSTYLLDRMRATITAASKLTFQQSTDAPPGLPNSLKITVASSYSPAATDALLLDHAIEGLNAARFGFGQSWAKLVCISFWVKGSVVGDYTVALENATVNRSYIGAYSITVANTWEFKFVVLTADTSGTWATDTSVGVRVRFDLGSGSNFNGAVGAWVAAAIFRAAGKVSFVSQANGSTLFITGVQFEEGPLPTAHELLPSDIVLLRCQRYFEKSFAYAIAPAQNVGFNTGEWRWSANTAGATLQRSPHMLFRVPKRAAGGTVTTYNTSAANANFRDVAAAGDCPVVAAVGLENGIVFQVTGAAGTAVGNSLLGHWTYDCEL